MNSPIALLVFAFGAGVFFVLTLVSIRERNVEDTAVNLACLALAAITSLVLVGGGR